jgi:hypothetical protein
VFVRKGEREREKKRKRESENERVRDSVCVRERERERECDEANERESIHTYLNFITYHLFKLNIVFYGDTTLAGCLKLGVNGTNGNQLQTRSQHWKENFYLPS